MNIEHGMLNVEVRDHYSLFNIVLGRINANSFPDSGYAIPPLAGLNAFFQRPT